MKKKLVTASLITILFIQGIAFAEPYKSNSFPPNNLIEKLLASYAQCCNFKIVGKHEASEGQYIVYYKKIWKDGTTRLQVVQALKLDTKIWIVNEHILSK